MIYVTALAPSYRYSSHFARVLALRDRQPLSQPWEGTTPNPKRARGIVKKMLAEVKLDSGSDRRGPPPFVARRQA